MVRAKFQCTQKTTNEYVSSKSFEVALFAVTSGSEENKAFFSSTPTGNIRLSVVNEAAANAFEVGKEYYVDFTPTS